MKEDLKRWDNSAEEWVNVILPRRQFGRFLGLPVIERYLAPINGKRILDAGCGNGWLSHELSEAGGQMVGVDGSPKMVAFAKKEFPHLDFRQADLAETLPFPNESFNAVIANFVLMSLNNAGVFLSEAGRILSRQGILVVGVFHPCFNFPTMSLYKSWLDKLLGRKPKGLAFDYYADAPFRKEAGLSRSLRFYHRTLSEYFRLFKTHGFAVMELDEPNHLPETYLKTHPKVEYATRLPRAIYFKLVKV